MTCVRLIERCGHPAWPLKVKRQIPEKQFFKENLNSDQFGLKKILFQLLKNVKKI